MEHLGLEKTTVAVVPHNRTWASSFDLERLLLHRTTSAAPEDIQHVGSTAIKGIVAKPILDIAIRNNDLDHVDEWIKPLEGAGYAYKGYEPGKLRRRFFMKGPEDNRVVYLHVVEDEEFERMTKFRDALNADSTLASTYSDLKIELAKQFPFDRDGYTAGKNNFISAVLASQIK